MARVLSRHLAYSILKLGDAEQDKEKNRSHGVAAETLFHSALEVRQLMELATRYTLEMTKVTVMPDVIALRERKWEERDAMEDWIEATIHKPSITINEILR